MVIHLEAVRPHKGKPYNGKIISGEHYKSLVKDHARKEIIKKRERILLELERRNDEKIKKMRLKQRKAGRKNPPIEGVIEPCYTNHTIGLQIQPKAKAIIGSVLNKYDMHWSAVINDSRKKHLVLIRFEMWDLLSRNGYSLPMIGKIFGRDHTTILHGVRTINERKSFRDSRAKGNNARLLLGSQQRESDGQEGDADRRKLATSEGGAEGIT